MRGTDKAWKGVMGVAVAASLALGATQAVAAPRTDAALNTCDPHDCWIDCKAMGYEWGECTDPRYTLSWCECYNP